MRHATFGRLDARVVGGTDGAGSGDGPLVVLLHGFGAPGDDLVPLARYLSAPKRTRFLFPAAPIRLPAFLGDSRAWWMIDLERRIETMMRGGLEELTREVPEGLAEARELVVELLDAAERELGADPEQIVLGGFSQGAMLALDVALRSGRTLAGLALMSGTLLCAEEWGPLMTSRAGLPVLLSHGRRDPLLPYALAVNLRDRLIAAGLQIDWLEFDGAHEIPPEVLERVGELIHRAID
jgi:phospholipase/carboxylesterase